MIQTSYFLKESYEGQNKTKRGEFKLAILPLITSWHSRLPYRQTIQMNPYIKMLSLMVYQHTFIIQVKIEYVI